MVKIGMPFMILKIDQELSSIHHRFIKIDFWMVVGRKDHHLFGVARAGEARDGRAAVADEMFRASLRIVPPPGVS